MSLDVQEGTYLKVAENVKISAAASENLFFDAPGPLITLPKSMKNQCEEHSMWNSIFDSKKMPPGPSPEGS